MTDKEKAIVMAYTGACMLIGDKFKIFHEYVENIMGRPVYTHEMAIKAVSDEITEKAKVDFIALCAEQEDVLDKITAEINAHKEELKTMAESDDWYAGKLRGHECDIEIIDKYKESEEQINHEP